jgi:hypothetical protein
LQPVCAKSTLMESQGKTFGIFQPIVAP